MNNPRQFLPILLIVCFASCSKTDNNVSTTGGTYSSINDVYSLLAVKSKFVTIDATAGGSFFGNSGTRYIFQPNSFQDGMGANVTGAVQVEVAEFLKKGDMLFSGVLPVSDTSALISGGELYANATQGGQKVYLKPGHTFQANMPRNGDTASGMVFFAGLPGTDSIKNKVNWKKGNDSAHTVVINGDTINMVSDSLKYCNADKFMSSPNYQNFTVTLVFPGGISTSNTVYGYTFYDNFKGFWGLGVIGDYINGVYRERHVPNIPVHFAVFTVINGKFYGGITAATPVTGNNYTVTLTETDPVTFKSQLDAL